jgi:DNA polymerase III subunit delta
VATINFNDILKDIKSKNTKPLYALDGEEPYFIDKICNEFEHHYLSEAEKDFNLTVMYGKDSNWVDVVNACKRYPMFAEKQIVILKEAQTLKDFGNLEAYFNAPLPTTIFVIAHKYKKFDARLKATKVLTKNGAYYTSNPIKEFAIPEWIITCGKGLNIKIGPAASVLLSNYLGNDLLKIANELEKIQLNLGPERELTEALITKYIGISKEFNVFDLPDAIITKNTTKVYNMLSYFLTHPKDAPMVLVLGSMYNKFSQIYGIHSMRGADDKTIAAALKMSSFFVKDIKTQAQTYTLPKAIKALDLVYEYNLKALGVEDNNDDSSLLKELVSKLMKI